MVRDRLQNFNDRLSVGTKVGLLLGIMVVLAGINVGVVYHYQSEVSTLGNSVNYAGQQRMLSQQMARYANNYAQTGSGDAADDLQAAIEQFDRNLQTLQSGGTINGNSLQPAPAATRDELQREQEVWTEYRQHVQTLLEADPGSEDFDTSLTYIQSNSDQLLEVSDEVTGAFSQVSTSKIAFMQQLLLGLFAIDVLMFLFGTFLGRRYISNPIQEITETADRLARGHLDVDISTETGVNEDDLDDELKMLARSFTGLEAYLITVADQAMALADQDFDADVLDEDVPGELGDSLDQMRDDLETFITDLEETRIEAEEARTEAEELTEALEQQATTFSRVMAAAADGDITQRMDPDSRSDAMTEIAEAFNAMMDDLEDTLVQIRAFADDVAASSVEVTASTAEVQDASELVSESVQEISADSEAQSDSLQEVASEMQSLSGTVEEVASSATQIAATSQETAELGRKGNDSASQAMEELSDIQTKSNETIAEIESLDAEMEEIGDIVEMITDIAEQTNLLALNASIEAARAGEAGEGFAVVADEIKQLAGEVAGATDEVEDLIDEIQSSTSDAVTDMREMGDRVSSGTATVEDALAALDDIATNVEEVDQSIQEISAAADDQASSTEEVASKIDEVADAAEQVSSEANNVSAAAEEQTSSLTQVSDSAQSLTDQADELQDLLSQFTVQEHTSAEAGQTSNQVQASADGGGERLSSSDDDHR